MTAHVPVLRSASAPHSTGGAAAAAAGPHQMLKLTVRLPGGDALTVDAIEGLRLVELLRAHELPVKAECGGAGVCATCHVRIPHRWQDQIPEASDEELARLDEIPGACDSSRLACQIEMNRDLDGLELEIAADSFADDKHITIG